MANKLAFTAALIWTLILGGSLTWILVQGRQNAVTLAQAEATTIINKDFALRLWVISQGGIYVSPSDKTPPNPYLAHVPTRDVVTSAGQPLTLMNSSYVLRQVMQWGEAMYGTKTRITSLHPLNPDNRADAWETQALERLKKGENEFTQIQEMNGAPYVRMARALRVEPSCLKCHNDTRIGGMRGAVSTSVPIDPYYDLWRKEAKGVGLTYLAVFILGISGIFLGRNALLRRIGEREKANSALLESNKRLALHQQQTMLAYIEVDPHLRVTQWNPAAEKIFEFSREEVIGRRLDELIIPEAEKKAAEASWKALLSSGTEGKNNITENITKHGKQIICEWNETPLTDASGNIIGLVSLVQDISERVHAEESLKQLNQNLAQRVQEEVSKNRDKDHLLMHQSRLAAMGEMVHNIAHQWRQPLNALGLVIANIRDDYQYGELDQQRLNDAVEKSTMLLNNMSKTIDDFKDFFRPDLEKEKFDVANAIRETANLIDASLKNNFVSIDMDLPEGVIAYGFPSQFSQALLNVITNAKEAIQQRGIGDGRIRLSLRAEEGRALVTVNDNGGGIPRDILAKVFDPYFTTKETGSGIGLYMTKTIIERNMGGQVLAHNTEDGVEVTVSVPLAAPKEPEKC
ncbi:MAG: DUF3365 domain-containing protein [Sulfuricella sp.]